MGLLDLVRITQSGDRCLLGSFRGIPLSSLKRDAKMKTKDLKQSNASRSQKWLHRPRRRHDPRVARPPSLFIDLVWLRRITLVEQAAAEGGLATRCLCSTCQFSIRQAVGNASSIRIHSARMFGYEKNNIFSVLSQSRRRARNVRLVHCSSKQLRTWLSYACWLYRAKKDSLSQAASAASNLRYEPAARIARRFANLAAKAIAPFSKF